MKPVSFDCQGNQSIKDLPSPTLPVFGPNQMQPIPDSVPADVKLCFKNFFNFENQGCEANPKAWVEHHIHTGSHPPVFAKTRRLDPEKLEIAKAEFKRFESVGIIRRSKSQEEKNGAATVGQNQHTDRIEIFFFLWSKTTCMSWGVAQG